MSFAEYNSEVNCWLESCETKLKILSLDESKRRFDFHVPNSDISFFIITPEEDSEWHVWSDEESFSEQLLTVTSYIDSSRTKKITDILNKLNASIKLSDKANSDASDDESFEDAVEDENAEDNNDDDDDVADDYYGGDDAVDVTNDGAECNDKESDDDEEEEGNFFASKGNQAAVQRLLKDLKSMKKDLGKFGFLAEPRNNNLFIWDVKLIDIPTDTTLGKNVGEYAKKYNREPVINMEMQFPDDYPMSPPFVRVVRPRFKFLTGHVTIGGSICMEMLTKSGWRPTNDIESILIQIRAEILTDKNAALNVADADRHYTEHEARDAFTRMVQRYGWNK